MIKKKLFSGLKRNELMSRIKSKGNKKTEIAFLNSLKNQKISGWRRHPRLPGTPDFIFKKNKIAIFLDGCFWHGCPIHFKSPTTNTFFWDSKIKNNKDRDKKNIKELKSLGWKVIRIWEHELTKKKIHIAINKLKKLFI